MSSSLYVRKIAKQDLMAHAHLTPVLNGEPLDSVDVTLGDAEGFSLVWISPSIGIMMEGLVLYFPQAWNTLSYYQVTKEQLLSVLEVTREIAKRDKADFQNPEEHLAYLMKEFKGLEELLSSIDTEKYILVAGQS